MTTAPRYARSKVARPAALAIVLAAALSGTGARASEIPFAVIGPRQYDLQTEFKAFNVLIQYGYWNHDSVRFDSAGHKQPGPGTDTFFGITNYVRFFTLRFLPHIGLAVTALLTESRVQGPRFSVSGFADPLVGGAAWFKPSHNSSLGIQTYLLIPVGTGEVSGHYWGNFSTVLFDIQGYRFDLTADAGGAFRSTRHATDMPDLDKGSTFFTNVRVSYTLHKLFEPFVAYDFQVTTSDHDVQTRARIPNSNSRESAWGAGVVMRYADRLDVAVRYSGSIEGINTTATKAVYLRLTYAW